MKFSHMLTKAIRTSERKELRMLKKWFKGLSKSERDSLVSEKGK